MSQTEVTFCCDHLVIFTLFFNGLSQGSFMADQCEETFFFVTYHPAFIVRTETLGGREMFRVSLIAYHGKLVGLADIGTSCV